MIKKTGIQNEFGNVIRKARIANELTLMEVAEKIGVSPSYISSLEVNKEGTIPTDEMLHKVCRLLKLDFTELSGLRSFITNDISRASKKMSKSDTDSMAAFYRKCYEHNISPKKGLDLLDEALSRHKS